MKRLNLFLMALLVKNIPPVAVEWINEALLVAFTGSRDVG
jgi:hypothetical protein